MCPLEWVCIRQPEKQSSMKLVTYASKGVCHQQALFCTWFTQRYANKKCVLEIADGLNAGCGIRMLLVAATLEKHLT
jgi:hypothetical protein